MTDRYIVDAGPLGQIAHPKPQRPVLERTERLFALGAEIFISEVADYEVRRSFLLHRSRASIRRLDHLQTFCRYVPITTAIMRKAADFWAESRRRGKPTSDVHALDCDVIIAAQVSLGATIFTDNIGHLSQFAPTRRWADL